ncbi:MAG TPA: hypothetical protein VFG20_05625 [Planctomycetaceae bacterium]|jgi:hypothetical protein|nr:hypothetical protein [Planctomycetaceae bacterium]
MSRCCYSFAFIICTLSVLCRSADDDVASRQRLKLMESDIAELAVSSTSSVATRESLRFNSKPLLRYSDPTRGLTEANVLMDATVWRLGERGRPTGLVTLELYRSDATQGVLAYEFLSLSPDHLSMQHRMAPRIKWDSTESALKLSPVPDAPKPAMVAGARLLQLRQLSKRFTVRERLLNSEAIECRLLTQPIDRYESSEPEIMDGAIFAFANGTNPELGLIIECNRDQWSYGVVRLSAAETRAYLDGKEVAHCPLTNGVESTKGSYASNNRVIQLPAP